MALTSGTGLIDALIDGVHVGDNVVLLGDGGAPLELLIDRLVNAARGRAPLVVVNVREPWDRVVPDGVTVLDWSPARTGRPSELPDALDVGAELDTALASLLRIDEQVGSGATFVFDELTFVQDTWGREAALQLFLTACPRLYRRRSLAVWPVRASEHPPTFLRRLTEITQVVVEFTADELGVRVLARKADGRDENVVGRSVRAEVVDGDLLATEEPRSTRERIGVAIRHRRLERGASQVEVARRVGISASALSQIERGVRGPSGDTLVRLWEVLDVPFGPSAGAQRGYRVARRSGRRRRRLDEGMTGELLAEDDAMGAVWSLEMAAGASGTSAPFAVKSPETIVVESGVVDLRIGGHAETLHEGDAVLIRRATVTGWSNPGLQPARVVWVIHPTP